MQHPLKEKFEGYFASLSPYRQAGFFLWPSLKSDKIEKEEKDLLQKIKPSGMVFFKRNLSSLQQAKHLITEVSLLCDRSKDLFPTPFIASVDEEGGTVSRFPAPFPRGRPAEEFAQQQDEQGLINQVLHQCFVAKGMGINCILAPVADILTQNDNPVMKSRCFGTDAQSVIHFSKLVNQTILQEGLFSCAKHFPGHGNTTTDSHKESSTSHITRDTLIARELLPFQALVDDHVPFVMAAHIILPEISGPTPASLNPMILQDLLRKKLGFKGLILSDDLRMNAVAQYYGADATKTEKSDYLKQAAVDALMAGCDVLLSCHGMQDEVIIIESLVDKLKSDRAFVNLLQEKAWNIVRVLNPLN